MKPIDSKAMIAREEFWEGASEEVFGDKKVFLFLGFTLTTLIALFGLAKVYNAVG